jgi:hypothetical protein
MTRDLADAVKALAQKAAKEIFQPCEVVTISLLTRIFEPAIRDLIAQATAALDAAAQECDRHAAFCKSEADKGGNFEHLITRRDEAVYLAGRIRALRAADIAAKAKEREAQIRHEVVTKINKLLAIQSNVDLEQWEQLEIYIRDLKTKNQEHDAKIRQEEREAFCRKLDGWSKLALSNEQHGEAVGNEMLRYSRSVVRQYLHDIKKELMGEWANEANA